MIINKKGQYWEMPTVNININIAIPLDNNYLKESI
jgi:hypothetical protein